MLGSPHITRVADQRQRLPAGRRDRLEATGSQRQQHHGHQTSRHQRPLSRPRREPLARVRRERRHRRTCAGQRLDPARPASRGLGPPLRSAVPRRQVLADRHQHQRRLRQRCRRSRLGHGPRRAARWRPAARGRLRHPGQRRQSHRFPAGGGRRTFRREAPRLGHRPQPRPRQPAHAARCRRERLAPGRQRVRRAPERRGAREPARGAAALRGDARREFVRPDAHRAASIPSCRARTRSRVANPPLRRRRPRKPAAPRPGNQDWALRTRPIPREELEDALARRKTRVEARERSVPFHQQASTWSDLRSAVQAFCRGAGIDPATLSPEAQAMLPLVAGQLLRETVVGLNDILRARAAGAAGCSRCGRAGGSRATAATRCARRRASSRPCSACSNRTGGCSRARSTRCGTCCRTAGPRGGARRRHEGRARLGTRPAVAGERRRPVRARPRPPARTGTGPAAQVLGALLRVLPPAHAADCRHRGNAAVVHRGIRTRVRARARRSCGRSARPDGRRQQLRP